MQLSPAEPDEDLNSSDDSSDDEDAELDDRFGFGRLSDDALLGHTELGVFHWTGTALVVIGFVLLEFTDHTRK